jgi:Ca-activated chloride channel family protein
MVELTGGVRGSLVASAAAQETSHLTRRVEMLLDKSRHTGTRLLKTRLAAVVTALAAFAWLATRTPGLVAFALPPAPATSKSVAAPVRPAPAKPVMSATAQRPALLAQPAAPANRAVEPELVQIPVEVTDPLKRFVTGLGKDKFRLFEDGVEQEISQFSSEDAALSVSIVFGAGSSIGAKLDQVRQVVTEFFQTANPADDFFGIQFNNGPQIISGFTTNTQGIQSQLRFTQLKDKTTLLEAIHLALGELKRAKSPRKALLVISGGENNNSRYTKGEIQKLVRESEIRVYAIGISEPGASPEPPAGGDNLSELALLGEVAKQTGGRYHVVENLAELSNAAFRISIALRNLYALGYSPKNRIRDGQYRDVHVELVRP